MSTRSLFVTVLFLAAAAPAAGQEFVWSSDRPDAVAPLGVFGDRTLPAGSFTVGAQYARFSHEGVRFGSDFVDIVQLFDLFDIVPFAMDTDGYYLQAGYGVTDQLTLLARGGFLMRSREQLTEELSFFTLESQGIGDVEVQALYGVWEDDAVRVHLHAGASIPTGTVEATDDEAPELRTPGTLPYDMQLGSGAWGVTPGITGRVMNESGVVGGQLLATVHFLEKEDWRMGDRVEGNLWAAYRLNEFFSLSGRVHMISFEAIEGFDPELEPARDPGEWPISFSGTRVDLPVGVNLYVPEGTWAGHRLSLEMIFPVHESFDGPWLASDFGISVGWQFGG